MHINTLLQCGQDIRPLVQDLFLRMSGIYLKGHCVSQQSGDIQCFIYFLERHSHSTRLVYSIIRSEAP